MCPGPFRGIARSGPAGCSREEAGRDMAKMGSTFSSLCDLQLIEDGLFKVKLNHRCIEVGSKQSHFG